MEALQRSAGGERGTRAARGELGLAEKHQQAGQQSASSNAGPRNKACAANNACCVRESPGDVQRVRLARAQQQQQRQRQGQKRGDRWPSAIRKRLTKKARAQSPAAHLLFWGRRHVADWLLRLALGPMRLTTRTAQKSLRLLRASRSLASAPNTAWLREHCRSTLPLPAVCPRSRYCPL